MRWHFLLSSVVGAVIVALAAPSAHAQAKPAPKTAEVKQGEKKPEQAPTKTAKTMAKAAEHAEHRAFAKALAEPEQWLQGVKLTKAERTQLNSIERKYRTEITDLRKSHEAAEKAGKEDDSQLAARVQAIVDRERSDLRAVLTTAQQTTFDKNAAKKG